MCSCWVWRPESVLNIFMNRIGSLSGPGTWCHSQRGRPWMPRASFMCLHLISAGLIDGHHHSEIFMWVLGTKHRFSCLRDKHFTNCATSQAPVLVFFLITFRLFSWLALDTDSLLKCENDGSKHWEWHRSANKLRHPCLHHRKVCREHKQTADTEHNSALQELWEPAFT